MACVSFAIVALAGCAGGADDLDITGPQVDLSTLPIEVRATPEDAFITTRAGHRIARGELLVTLRPHATHEALMTRLASAKMTAIGRIPEAQIYQVRTAATTEQELAAAKAIVLLWPEVLRVTYNAETALLSARVPDDPGYGDSAWAFEMIGADAAWQKIADEGRTGARIRIGLIDGGFQSIPGELEFARLYAQDGTAVPSPLAPSAGITASPSSDPRAFSAQTASYHHGMNVAGLMAARADNATSTVGVAWQVPVEVHAAQKGSDVSNLANFARLVRSGVKVVNLSQGAGNPTQARESAPTWGHLLQVLSVGHEFLPVFAAGNQPVSAFDQGIVNALFDPSLPEFGSFALARAMVLIVGALDGDGRYADYSATGPAVHIAAPGGGRRCSLPTGVPTADRPWVYAQNATSDDPANCRVPALRGIKSLRYGGGSILNNGTSMAAPLVSGAAALVWSLHPSLSAARVKEVLIASGAAGRVAAPEGQSVPKLRVDQALILAAGGSQGPVPPSAPRVVSMTFSAGPPARLEVVFSEPMLTPNSYITGDYVPADAVWASSTRWVVTFQSYQPGGLLTLKAPAGTDARGFTSAARVAMSQDVPFRFP